MNAVCKSCGQTLPADAPQGMCPSCLLRAVLKPEELGQSNERLVSPTTQGPRVFRPESIDALRPLFPGLELISLLGYGGMGAVYKARQKKLDRLVALKIIRGDAAADPAFAERFNREARTLARLSHPGIVAIHDFGETTSSSSDNIAPPMFYFVMEFVDGTNLRQLMNGQKLPPEQAYAIVPQVCDALQFAHDEGVVHRDIKPENILIDRRGRVKIADFGLAKLVAGSNDDFTLTGTHQVMGTPRYMAPEQMEGSREVDHRADIYSLGVVFYEMLTGQIPAGHFDPPSHKANVDHRLDSIVLKAMARDPDRRFQRASEVRINVERLADELPAVGDPNASRAEEEASHTRPAPQSVSEFLSFEAASMAGWVAGTRPKHDGMPRTIRLLMPLLCLFSIGTLFQPWLEVYITDRDALVGVESRDLTIVPSTNIKALLRSLIPVDSNAGVVTGFCLAMALVVHLSAGRTLTRRGLLVQIALLALALAEILVFRQQVGTTQITVYADPETSAPPRNYVGDFENGVGRAYLSSLEHQSEFTQAAWLGFSSTLVVLLANAFSLQYASSSRPVPVRPKRMDLKATSQPEYGDFVTRSASLMPLQLASRLLLVIGIIGLFHLPGCLVIAFGPLPGNSIDEVEKFRVVTPFMVAVLGFNAISGFLAIIASQRILRGTGVTLARIACILTFPINVFAMPFAIWCLMVLGRVVPINESKPKSGSAMRWIVGLTIALVLIAFSVSLAVRATRQSQTAPQLLIETQNGDAAAVVRLLEAGADPNVQLETLGSPLFWAVCKGHPAIIEALVQHGAIADIKTYEGITPLMVASLLGDAPTVRLLIAKGALVNKRDAVSQLYTIFPRTGSINWPGKQLTPLMLAACQGHRAIVEELLAAGADPGLLDPTGKDAAQLAMDRNYVDIHDLIRSHQQLALERQ